MASLMMYSRSIGPRAARPSPPRENRVRPAPLNSMSTTASLPVSPRQQDGAAIAESGEAAELVPGVRRARGSAPSGTRFPANIEALGARLQLTRRSSTGKPAKAILLKGSGMTEDPRNVEPFEFAGIRIVEVECRDFRHRLVGCGHLLSIMAHSPSRGRSPTTAQQVLLG